MVKSTLDLTFPYDIHKLFAVGLQLDVLNDYIIFKITLNHLHRIIYFILHHSSLKSYVLDMHKIYGIDVGYKTSVEGYDEF